MVTMNMISYEDERLGFFADQRKLVQKRYDRLENQIKPDEPYTSERREFLSDCGRELSFYNDIIEMLENGVTPKSEIAKEIFNWIESNCYGDRDEDNGEAVICIYAQDYDEFKNKYLIE